MEKSGDLNCGMATDIADGKEISIESTDLEEHVLRCCQAQDLQHLQHLFQEQEEFIYIEKFIDQDLLDHFLLPQMEQARPYIHRNYIPMHKKGGSISSFSINQQAPLIARFYRSPGFHQFLTTVSQSKEPLLVCPDQDPHAVALYFYTEVGDHIGYHYDSSFYNGVRYTVLIGLVDNTTCQLVCNLYRGHPTKKPETVSISVNAGDMVLFNGDKVYHCVTPLKMNEERVVLSMEFLTKQDMGVLGRAISNVKDAVTYFGVGSLVGKYEGFNPQLEITQSKQANKFLEEDDSVQIIAFVNKLSGGQRGKVLIPLLQEILGSDNVFDMNAMGGPEPGLMKHLDTPNLRVIACGGDGTIRWVIQGLINAGFSQLPPLGVFPIGTGNDLSRMFGWGPGYVGENVHPLLMNYKIAKSKPMDIWTCSITPWDPKTGEIKNNETNRQIMFNYFNIGFDAQVANGFHTLRNSRPELFPSRFVNKCWYFYYALENIIRGSNSLAEHLELEIDGIEILIPPSVKTIVVLNFICYQAGVDIWGPDQEENRPKMDDGIVEVIGLGSFIHEALVRTYLSSGMRLGRGKEIKMKYITPVSLPIGLDGEPFVHSPAIISIKSFGQVEILEHPDQTARQ